jgi:hypothetical protein
LAGRERHQLDHAAAAGFGASSLLRASSAVALPKHRIEGEADLRKDSVERVKDTSP